MDKPFDVIAHRGGRGTHPENTMAAFENALRCGADGIEFDVRLSKDGVPVVFHDDVLERTTDGHGRVSDFTAAELSKRDAGNAFDSQFRGERIPLLSDLLSWASTNDLQLHLEIKTGPAFDQQLVEAITDALKASTVVERTLVFSFNHDILVEARRLLPELRTAVLYWFGLHRPWDYAHSIGASALTCRWDGVTKSMVECARAENVDVRGFDVWDEATVQAVATTNCKGLYSPCPELAVDARSKLMGEANPG